MSAVAQLRARIEAHFGQFTIDAELETNPGPLVLAGPNGAGKSTLLRLLLGAQPVTRGRIETGGVVLLDTAAGIDVPLEARRLGYLPQDYALFPHLTARANIEFALAARRDTRSAGRAKQTARVETLLRDLALTPLADRFPRQLSGGERQRVALARAMAVEPRAVLLDEPLAALDIHARREVREFLAGWLRRTGVAAVVVTHDAADARLLGNRVAVIEAGRITQTGTWDELTLQPATPFVAEFVSPA